MERQGKYLKKRKLKNSCHPSCKSLDFEIYLFLIQVQLEQNLLANLGKGQDRQSPLVSVMLMSAQYLYF